MILHDLKVENALRGQPHKRQQIKEQAFNECLEDCQNSYSYLFTVVEAYILSLSTVERLNWIQGGNRKKATEVLGFNPETGEEVPE